MKKRFLVTSILMLLLTVFALSTSTYAWFSMNTQVTATGMQVVAKTDDTYLLIGSGDNDTAAKIQNAEINTTTALTVTDIQAKLFASSPCLKDAHVSYLTVAEGHKKVNDENITVAGVTVNSATTAAAVTNWFTAKAATQDASTIKAETARQLVSFDGYVIKRTVYLTVAVGANPANNLSVTATINQKTGGNDISACKILVTTDDNGFAILNTKDNQDNPILTADIKGSNTDITSTSVRRVDIYIYYDGEDSKVYTNNAANLTGADISLAFNVESNPAA